MDSNPATAIKAIIKVFKAFKDSHYISNIYDNVHSKFSSFIKWVPYYFGTYVIFSVDRFDNVTTGALLTFRSHGN